MDNTGEFEVFYNFIDNLRCKDIDSNLKLQIYQQLYNYWLENKNFLPQKLSQKLKNIFNDDEEYVAKVFKDHVKAIKKVFDESGVEGIIKVLENVKPSNINDFCSAIQDLVIQITPKDMKSILNIGIDNTHLFLSIFFSTIMHEKGTPILDIIFDDS